MFAVMFAEMFVDMFAEMFAEKCSVIIGEPDDKSKKDTVFLFKVKQGEKISFSRFLGFFSGFSGIFFSIFKIL